MTESADGLVASLRSMAGDSLRVVAEYDRDGYEPLYVREDAVRRFEDLAAFNVAGEGYTGLFVSLDPDADVRLASFAQTSREWVG
ncbi:MAG: hypothetical protein ABEJ42_09000 [Halobacteriaceae archaeon]